MDVSIRSRRVNLKLLTSESKSEPIRTYASSGSERGESRSSSGRLYSLNGVVTEGTKMGKLAVKLRAVTAE